MSGCPGGIRRTVFDTLRDRPDRIAGVRESRDPRRRRGERIPPGERIPAVRGGFRERPLATFPLAIVDSPGRGILVGHRQGPPGVGMDTAEGAERVSPYGFRNAGSSPSSGSPLPRETSSRSASSTVCRCESRNPYRPRQILAALPSSALSTSGRDVADDSLMRGNLAEHRGEAQHPAFHSRSPGEQHPALRTDRALELARNFSGL